MLGICRWEYTINETCIGHFLCKYWIYNKIKIKLPLLKNYIVLLKKNRTLELDGSLVFCNKVH